MKWNPEGSQVPKKPKRKGGRRYKKKRPGSQLSGLQNHNRRNAKRKKGAAPSSSRLQDNENAWNAMLEKLPVVEGEVIKYYIPPGKQYPEMKLDEEGK